MISANGALTSSYNYGLAALSVLMAVSASYAALDLAGRVTAARGWPRSAWLSGGAAAMGLGIWSMHFIGMLALSMPVPVAYDQPTVLLSLLTVVLSSAFALYVVSRQKMGLGRALGGSVIMGGGIAGLHYIGMAAMRLAAVSRFSPLLVAFSIVLAVIFSLAALMLAFDLREETRGTVSRRLASAAVMGVAISAMHYTGMASASFVPSNVAPDLSHAVSITSLSTLGIGAVILMVLGLAIFMCWTDRQLAAQAKELERRVIERTSELTAVNLKLTEAEERFRRLVEALPDAVFVHSNNRVVFVNPACLRLLGAQEAEQLLGKDISQIIHPDSLALVKQRIQQCYETGAASSPKESALVTVDGSMVEIEAAANPITWKGSPAIEVIAREIAERKRAEEALRQTQTRTESVLESVADIHILFDRSWHYLYVNRAAVRGIGRPREQILGRTLWELFPDIVGTELERQYRRAMEEQLPVAFDFHYLTTDTWWANRFYPAPEGLSVFATDITERKRAEQELQKAQAELARVARIAIMGELTASIAHEINQPLAAIVTDGGAALRWLAMQPPNLEEAREAMASAIREANRASDVIGRIRALLTKTSPEMRALDINEVIREVLTLTGNELVRGGVTVQTELGGDLPAVLGDRVQLQQVMLNLIMNSIDAMRTVTDRPRELLITTAEDPNGVLIQVQDSGIGLTAEQADRIFEPFFTTKPEGIGMGLPISRSIVEAHGGRLWATPGHLQGAVFQFTLPKEESFHD